ncbi:glycosyl hydrolase [Histoplasma capsulatum H143]|uniref:Glycosyl hydrolase n=1 Tax=Ajellomyces capsulatus (strain H143) TaxID=544712 RepID=C6H7L4_AJECH|nr:glycosyl hydrolase [Histoplasma capsulatum H143]
MARLRAGLLFLCLWLLAGPAAAEERGSYRILDFVDPLIGTTNGGHVFPGATLPYGMAKAGPDTDGEAQGGFDGNALSVRGFSHMHDSGTGGSFSFGAFSLFAHSSCPDDNMNKCKFDKLARATPWVKDSVKASPGYFGITLQDGVTTEMTVTNRSALYKFSFPENPFPGLDVPLSPFIIVDLSDMQGTRHQSKVSVDPETGRVKGGGSFSPSFGKGTYQLYFCTDFQGADVRRAGIFKTEDGKSIPVLRTDSNIVSGLDTDSDLLGAFVQFQAPDNRELIARVGLSFMSIDQACSNAEREQPFFDFDATVSAAEEVWAQKLGVIEVSAVGLPREFEVTFWSGVYRTLISPQDYTGENPLWKSDEPYYDNFYCIWDSFRTTHPFITILDPQAQANMVRSLIDIYRHEDWLPDCRMSLCKGFTQGGSNADVVLADAFVKRLPGIDWKTGYEALIKDAEVTPPDWSIEGRGDIEGWKSVGYVPVDSKPKGRGVRSRSVSRTVEYAYNDFCIALLSKALGHEEDYIKYTDRAKFWKNLYREDQTIVINGTDTGFVGCLQPRHENGEWSYQNPIQCSPLLNPHSCYLNEDGGESYEGSLFMYTFYVPQDMAALVNTLGGPDAFTKRLDYLHESGLLYVGNEQAFLSVYQYHYSGRPALSAQRAHFYIPSQFNNTPNGIPGNDDSGAIGSFLAFAMIGLYPVAGQDVYLITPPFFAEVKIRNPLTGNVAIIRNIHFDPSYRAIYIQRVKRDGKSWRKNWIGHDFFENGGVLELILGKRESKWGTRMADLPPSLSTGGDLRWQKVTG